MYVLLLAIFLQSSPPTRDVVIPSTSTVTKRSTEVPDRAPPEVQRRVLNTTPDLFPDAHLQMEHDIGTQGEAIYNLGSRVSTLETLRLNPDRKDIDDLKDARNHIEWTWTILATVFGTLATVLWFCKRFIWTDIIRPRLAQDLANTQKPHPSS